MNQIELTIKKECLSETATSGPNFFRFGGISTGKNGYQNLTVSGLGMTITGMGFQAHNTDQVWVSQSYPGTQGRWNLQLRNSGPAATLTVWAVYF